MAKPQDNVAREFQAIGRYRIRLLATDNGQQVLDIREYVTADQANGFEGFTRRGIRLAVPQDTAVLAATLAELQPEPVPAKPKKGGKK